MEEAQDRKVGFGMGGGVEVLSHRDLILGQVEEDWKTSNEVVFRLF